MNTRVSTAMRKLAILFVALLSVSACDSGDPDDAPHPRDVAGIYDFTRFTFEPSGSAFEPIMVLDTLDRDETNLRLSSGGEFILTYQFTNGDLFFPVGTFEVTSQAVALDGDRDDRDHFRRLLLDEDFTLRRDGNDPRILAADIQKTINPSSFSDRYAGVESMSGTLRLRLERR